MANSGCVHCPHFGCRTGSYWGRIGPDSACFRGSPAFAGEGMQFESHLGHSIPPRQRGFCFNVCTSTRFGSLLRLSRRCGLAAAVAYGVMWVAGSGPWLVGLPPAGVWSHSRLFSRLFEWAWLALYLFMPWGCGDDMTCGKLLPGFGPLLAVSWGMGEPLVAVCPAKHGCAQCPHPCPRDACRGWVTPSVPISADTSSCSQESYVT
jgi:hypothetical protein